MPYCISEAHVSSEGTPVFGSDLTSFRVVPTEAAKTRRVHLRQSAQFLASPSVYITSLHEKRKGSPIP